MEIEACEALERAGYKVLKRGWPDFLAWKEGEVRFIEVKSNPNTKGLKSTQKIVAQVLEKIDINVELVHPGNIKEWVGNL